MGQCIITRRGGNNLKLFSKIYKVSSGGGISSTLAVMPGIKARVTLTPASWTKINDYPVGTGATFYLKMDEPIYIYHRYMEGNSIIKETCHKLTFTSDGYITFPASSYPLPNRSFGEGFLGVECEIYYYA